MSMYEKKRERKFQLEMLKTQVDTEFTLAIIIGVLAIAYSLLLFFQGDPFPHQLLNVLGYWLSSAAIYIAVILLVILYLKKEKKFKTLKKEYIESHWS